MLKARHNVIVATALTALAVLAGCQHKVKVEAPDEPIVINLNVKIEQEVRVKVEKDLEELLAENPELFGGTQQ